MYNYDNLDVFETCENPTKPETIFDFKRKIDEEFKKYDPTDFATIEFKTKIANELFLDVSAICCNKEGEFQIPIKFPMFIKYAVQKERDIMKSQLETFNKSFNNEIESIKKWFDMHKEIDKDKVLGFDLDRTIDIVINTRRRHHLNDISSLVKDIERAENFLQDNIFEN